MAVEYPSFEDRKDGLWQKFKKGEIDPNQLISQIEDLKRIEDLQAEAVQAEILRQEAVQFASEKVAIAA